MIRQTTATPPLFAVLATLLGVALLLHGQIAPALAATPSLDIRALPSEPIALPGAFVLARCDGGPAPIACISEGSTPQGVIEHLELPLSGLDELRADLASGTGRHAALVAELDRYHRTIRTDRAETCPQLQYVADPTVGALVGGHQGVMWGASLLTVEAAPRLVERTVGFSGLRGDVLDVVVAHELDDGSCTSAEGTLPFTDGALGRFTPTFRQLVAHMILGDGAAPMVELATSQHLQAADVIAGAVALAQLAVVEGGVDTVLVARDDVFADALASGLLQGSLDAPLLFTSGDRLDPRTAAEIERLGASRAIVLGGESALAPAVAADLTRAGLVVQRVGGADRVATALAVADLAAPVTEEVLVVRADAGDGSDATREFADAIAAGAVAADLHAPVLLTAGTSLDPRVATWLDDRGVERALVVGGDAAVQQPVLQELVEIGIGLDRAAGTERAETASMLGLRRGLPTVDHAGAVLLVDGRSPADGMAIALLAHRAGATVLLTDADRLPRATADQLTGTNPADPPVLVCAASVADAACAEAGRLLGAS